MKKVALAVCLIVLSFAIVLAQSRRPTTNDGGKTNQRPTATPSPTPQPTENTDANVEVDIRGQA